ncbi:MAG: hemerythrin domain-containing protein [Rhodocyclaceae bacterium]|nr:hemerythrin domain-containing protein [Rhodocyclaceae bacterium]
MSWNPDYSVGDATLDDQHRDILARCDALGECLGDAAADDARFRADFDALMARAREHFAAEKALLAARGYPELDAQQDEYDEFEYLAAEIVTTENFDKVELQRFLALWWVGHIVGSGRKQRAFLQK